MACGFCRKSLEGLRPIEKPKPEKEPSEVGKMLFDLKIDIFDSELASEVVQCQMCEEYWRKDFDIVVKESDSKDVLRIDGFDLLTPEPDFVVETKAVQLGYDKSKIWEN